MAVKKKAPPAEEVQKKPTLKKEVISLEEFELTDPDEISHFNGIIYGPSGAGKTHLCGTAGEYELTTPALVIDCEKGTTSLFGFKGVKILKPHKWKDIQKMYQYLRTENTYFKSVVIDSLTEMQKHYSIGSIMNELDEEEGSYADISTANAPTRQDWLRTGEQMKKVIRAFRDLAYLPDKNKRLHVFMICLETMNDKRNMIHPTLSGSLGIDCGAAVDFLFRLSSQSVLESDDEGNDRYVTRRHLLTDRYVDEEDIIYLAKNRGSFFKKSIWDPNIESIMEKLPKI